MSAPRSPEVWLPGSGVEGPHTLKSMGSLPSEARYLSLLGLPAASTSNWFFSGPVPEGAQVGVFGTQ